jgi:hypothetical protein
MPLTLWSPSPDNRKMTDGDIERCKQFRHFSTGNLIFYLVMVAALIAMFNETLIDQLMDLSISSVWLGFLLFNFTIYTISPVLVVAIYVTILGLTGYRSYVFIPAIKRARAARASKLRSAQNFNGLKLASTRPGKGISRSCSALISKIMDNIGQLMYLLSNSEKISRAKRVRENNEIWTSMNRTQSDTVIGPMAPRSAGPRRFSNLVNSTAHKIDRTLSMRRRTAYRRTTSEMNPEVCIPPLILAMRGTGVIFVTNSDNYVADQITAKAFFSSANDCPTSCSQEMPIVYATSALRAGVRAKCFSANKGTTSDPHVALRRLLLRHFLGPAAAERGDEISFFEAHEALHCTFYLSELESLLNFICDIYYPNNNVLTEDERVEVFENFHSWRQSASLRTAAPYCGSVSKEVAQLRDRVHFSDFSSWFLLVSRTLTVAHTTR